MSAYPMGWHSTDLGGGRACNVPVWSMSSVSASEFPAWWAAHWRMQADLETKLFAGYEPVEPEAVVDWPKVFKNYCGDEPFQFMADPGDRERYMHTFTYADWRRAYSADLPAPVPRAPDSDSIPGLLAAARERMGRE